jgi:peptidoglycan biosynthesis protein MviN/MurJ (putative lipid II flippase)
VQTAFIRCDAYIIDAALQPGRRVRVSAVAAVVGLGLSVLLTWYAGLIGLCLGVLAGRGVQTIWYPMVVRDCLDRTPQASPRWLLRILAIMAVLFAGSTYLGQRILVQHWAGWALAVLLTAIAAFILSLEWGLPGNLRAAVKARLMGIWSR